MHKMKKIAICILDKFKSIDYLGLFIREGK